MADIARWTPQGERVIWSAKPHPLFILLRRVGLVLGLLLLAGAIAWALAAVGDDEGELSRYRGALVIMIIALAGATVLWSALVWLNQEFVLTEERAIWASGVVRRLVVQVPLERVQNVAAYRSLRERVFGLGTVGLATAGTGSFEIVWPMLARPAAVMQTLTEAVNAARARGPSPDRSDPISPVPAHPVPPQPHPAAPAPPVIGLAGGIGAGKSEVARIMAARGCLVVDSDKEAKAALDRPEVRDELVRWWGGRVLTGEGRIDRRAVAAIVFADEGERRRLETLVHPLVQSSRREVVEAARRAAAADPSRSPPRAVVVDAPLLFEAGVDRECDAVVFVDAPRELRQERVRASRGWDEAELSRREAAQLPLEEKRRRSRYLVMNTGSAADLEGQVDSALRRIGADADAAQHRRPPAAGSGSEGSKPGDN